MSHKNRSFRFELAIARARDPLNESMRGQLDYYDVLGISFGEHMTYQTLYPVPSLLNGCFGLVSDLIRFFLNEGYAEHVVVLPRLRHKGDSVGYAWLDINKIILEHLVQAEEEGDGITLTIEDIDPDLLAQITGFPVIQRR